MSTLRVLVVDDHPIVISGLTALLAATDDVRVVATAVDGRSALRELSGTDVDVALVDLRLPDLDGAELCRRMLVARPALRVVVFSMYGNEEAVRSALDAGASGYLLKDSAPDHLADAVRLAARGALVVGSGARAALTRPAAAPDPVARDALGALSRREFGILELVARGLPTNAVAERLGLAPKTVRNRLSDIYLKLGVTDRVAAVALLHDAGALRPPAGPAPSSRQPRP